MDIDKHAHDFIESLQKGEHFYKLGTTIPGVVIDEATFRITENDNYELSFKLQSDNKNKDFNLDYFFQRPFMLVSKGMSILIQNFDVTNGSQSIAEDKPFDFKVEVKAFKGDTDENLWKQSKQTAYFAFDKKRFSPSKSGIRFDLTTSSNDNGFYNAIKLLVDKVELLFYYEDISPQSDYFIFRPNGIIDFEKFQHIIESTITAYGFLSGDYIEDRVYYFAMKDVKGKGVLSYRYDNSKRSFKTNTPIIDTGHYENIPRENLQLDSIQFNKLVNLLYENEEYLRSALLLINAGNLKGCAKASLATVALEAITNKVGAKFSTKNIIEDKQIDKGLRYQLKKTLKVFADRLDKNQFEILSTKLNQINSKPNRSKLEDAFQLLGITLDDEEKECISYRNLFLHGSLPRKNEEMWMTDIELLDIVANRLVMLSSILLLKQANYNGMVIDRGMTEVIKWRMIKNFQKATGGNCLRSIATWAPPRL